MVRQAYIGNPNQQNNVVISMADDFRKNVSGIFVIGGGGRVGKNTAMEKVVDSIGLVRDRSEFGPVNPSINMTNYDVGRYLGRWPIAYEGGRRVFAFGEIYLKFERAFEFIRDFYHEARSRGGDIKILFNVVSRDYPAWEGDKINKSLEADLMSIFGSNLYLHNLAADNDKIASEMWRMKNEGGIHDFLMLAQSLGFDNNLRNQINLNDEKSFKSFLRVKMGESGYGNPEL